MEHGCYNRRANRNTWSTTTYSVTVTNSSTGCTSIANQVVTVVSDPSITAQPASATICSGGTQTLSVTATGGTPSLTYQWQSSTDNSTFTNISGATSSSSYDTSPGYHGLLQGDCECFGQWLWKRYIFFPATVTVVTDPAISTHPTSFTECVGGTAALSVAGTGGCHPCDLSMAVFVK